MSTVSAAGLRCRNPASAAAAITKGKGSAKTKRATKATGRCHPVGNRSKGAARHFQQRLEHNRQYGCLQPPEHGGDGRHIAEVMIEHRKRQNDKRTGNDEEKPGNKPARNS